MTRREFLRVARGSDWNYETRAIIEYIAVNPDEKQLWEEGMADLTARYGEDYDEDYVAWVLHQALHDYYRDELLPRETSWTRGGAYSLLHDLAGAAFTRVDWDEVARFLLEQL